MAEQLANSQASTARLYHQRWRLIKDSLVRYIVIVGGLGVIAAIVLIFFYLLYVVLPLFGSAKLVHLADYGVPSAGQGKTWLLDAEEQNQIAVRFTDQGYAIFFDLASGKSILTQKLTIPDSPATSISSFAQASPLSQGGIGYGLADGRIVLAKQHYQITYGKDNKRLIVPDLTYPFGESPITIMATGEPIKKLAIRLEGEEATIAAVTDSLIKLVSLKREQSLLEDTPTINRTEGVIEVKGTGIQQIMADQEGRNLYVIHPDGRIQVYDISEVEAPKLKYQQNLIAAGQTISSLAFLNGDISLLVGDSSGQVTQWTQAKNESQQLDFKKIRAFNISTKPIIDIKAEQRRKGFIATDAEGFVAVIHSTAERELVKEKLTFSSPVATLISPRANRILIESNDGKFQLWQIDNEHPEVSVKSLWNKIWYESYPKPDYIWQSSSASNDFEPKYSLVPLVFGTVKAAFYALLVALPLALMGAIYTAYFMAPAMRQIVKPTIELMGALPTVILGFLAGLWLAPFVEKNLAGLFLSLVSLPIAVLLVAYGWQLLPAKFRQRIPDGWEVIVVIPVIIATVLLAFAISHPVEAALFHGSMRDWLSRELGIGYDQRNALIVGMAMGFAVVPTIFSISEDAIFSVPKHLTIGSLALGATPWQTMTKVVLLTASPGIFSAVMIGLGRAIGETMIVLMATGNTPVMDFSVFQGLRTLAANVAVEMPESEVNSTHYRVLFLAALVLFLATFVFNTLAEVIRQRLREKYSSL